jgi:hypothetical protein
MTHMGIEPKVREGIQLSFIPTAFLLLSALGVYSCLVPLAKALRLIYTSDFIGQFRIKLVFFNTVISPFIKRQQLM